MRVPILIVLACTALAAPAPAVYHRQIVDATLGPESGTLVAPTETATRETQTTPPVETTTTTESRPPQTQTETTTPVQEAQPVPVQSSSAASEAAPATTQSETQTQTQPQAASSRAPAASSSSPLVSPTPQTQAVTATKSDSTEIVTITAAGPGAGGLQNGAVIYFPTNKYYWVYNALAVVQWAPAIGRPVNLRLDNPDTSLLEYSYILSSGVPGSFTSMSVSLAKPCHPGEGYVLTLEDATNGTVYAKSEPFELKPQGTPPVMPYGINAETAVAGAQGASGGVRRVPLFSMSMISSAWVQAGVAGLAVWFLR